MKNKYLLILILCSISSVSSMNYLKYNKIKPIQEVDGEYEEYCEDDVMDNASNDETRDVTYNNTNSITNTNINDEMDNKFNILKDNNKNNINNNSYINISANNDMHNEFFNSTNINKNIIIDDILININTEEKLIKNNKDKNNKLINLNKINNEDNNKNNNYYINIDTDNKINNIITDNMNSNTNNIDPNNTDDDSTDRKLPDVNETIKHYLSNKTIIHEINNNDLFGNMEHGIMEHNNNNSFSSCDDNGSETEQNKNQIISNDKQSNTNITASNLLNDIILNDDYSEKIKIIRDILLNNETYENENKEICNNKNKDIKEEIVTKEEKLGIANYFVKNILLTESKRIAIYSYIFLEYLKSNENNLQVIYDLLKNKIVKESLSEFRKTILINPNKLLEQFNDIVNDNNKSLINKIIILTAFDYQSFARFYRVIYNGGNDIRYQDCINQFKLLLNSDSKLLEDYWDNNWNTNALHHFYCILGDYNIKILYKKHKDILKNAIDILNKYKLKNENSTKVNKYKLKIESSTEMDECVKSINLRYEKMKFNYTSFGQFFDKFEEVFVNENKKSQKVFVNNKAKQHEISVVVDKFIQLLTSKELEGYFLEDDDKDYSDYLDDKNNEEEYEYLMKILLNANDYKKPILLHDKIYKSLSEVIQANYNQIYFNIKNILRKLDKEHPTNYFFSNRDFLFETLSRSRHNNSKQQ